MSIPMNSLCVQCHLERTLKLASRFTDDDGLTALTRELLQLYLDTPPDASSPFLGPATNEILHRLFGIEPDRLRKEKEDSNRFVLERLEDIYRRIDAAPDPVYAALQFSVLGNYLDFAALQDRVSFADLQTMLDSASEMDLDRDTYRKFSEDLCRYDQLLILTDNAGEIVFDMVLAQYIARKYGHMHITFCVRGGPTHNDATMEDASAINLPFRTIHNGNTVGGTELSLLSPQAERELRSAGIIIAKGMGNTETLAGCGLNVYYAFLVKCRRFVQYFGKPMMTPMFVSEQSIQKEKDAKS